MINELKLDYNDDSLDIAAEIETEYDSQDNWDLEVDIEKKAKDNYNLIFYVVNKYTNATYPVEELLGPAHIGFTKALNTFDKEKGYKFSTYAVKCIQNEVIGFLRKENKYHKTNILLKVKDNEESEQSITDLIDNIANNIYNNGKSTEDLVIKEEELKMLYEAINKLTKQEKFVLTLRYGLNNEKIKTQKEIGDTLKLSQSYINRIEKQALKKIYNLISN